MEKKMNRRDYQCLCRRIWSQLRTCTEGCSIYCRWPSNTKIDDDDDDEDDDNDVIMMMTMIYRML